MMCCDAMRCHEISCLLPDLHCPLKFMCFTLVTYSEFGFEAFEGCV